MTQPSGWYDDPQDPSQVRYWDGVVWTERVTPKVNPNVERSTIGSPKPREQAGDESGSSGGRHHSPWATPRSGAERPGQVPRQQGQQTGHDPYGQWQGQGRPAHGTRPTTPDGQPLSGWWRRVVARVADGIIVAILTIPFTYWAYGPVQGSAEKWLDDVLQAARSGSSQTPAIPPDVVRYVAIISGVMFVLYGIYEVLFLSRTGATPGKRLAGISVRLRDRPGPITVRAALERYLVKEGPAVVGLLPTIGFLASLFMLVNYLWPLWDPRNQALHDKVVQTNVVLGRQPRRPSPVPADSSDSSVGGRG